MKLHISLMASPFLAVLLGLGTYSFCAYSFGTDSFAAEPPTTIRLGFIGALSGEAAPYGQDERNAINMAVEEINSRKYIPNTQLEVLFEDAKCSGKEASIAAHKLIDIDKVKIIFGGVCSGETLAAAPITEKAEAILLSVFSSHPQITEAGDFVFRMAPSDEVGARLAADLMKSYKQIGILTENTDYAVAFRKTFIEQVQKNGGEVVADESYNSSENDLRPLLMRMRAKKPEALFLNPNAGGKAGLMVRQLREQKWILPLFGTYAFSSPEAFASAGGIERLEGLKFVDAPDVVTQTGLQFIARFKEKYPAPQSSFETLLRYDSVYLLVDAIKAVGFDTKKIRDFLYQMPYRQGLEYKFKFDKNGDIEGVSYKVKEVKNGKVVALN